MNTIALKMMGRFGNMMFQYAFARAFAKQHGLRLEVEPWPGQFLFELDDPPISRDWPMLCENTITDDAQDFCYRSYSQQQKCLIYTRSEVRQWFRVRDSIKNRLAGLPIPQVACHRRVGDYPGYGYVVVSKASYERKLEELGLADYLFITEENAANLPGFGGGMAFFPDFWRLMNCRDTLLRGNSCFSWWAATLNPTARIYSPIIDGLTGGMEQDCEFVEGNWPRFANYPFVTDLHLKP